MKYNLFLLVLAMAFTGLVQAVPVPTLQTIPASGSLESLPGSVIGWGFNLGFSATSDWIVLNDSFFTGSTVYGTYVDYIANQFVLAGPAPESATVTEPWVLGTAGLGEFDVDKFVPPGTTIGGAITVDYSVFSQDPNSPNFDPSSFVSAEQVLAPVSLTIASVPEPHTLSMAITAGIAGFAALRWRLRR